MSFAMLDEKFYDELECIRIRDDKESFVELLRAHPEKIGIYLVSFCAAKLSKKCLTTLVNGEVCEQPPPLKGWDRCIHLVSFYFPDPDVISIMLERGAIMNCNIKCKVDYHDSYGTPLYLSLDRFSYCEKELPIESWSEGDSIFKLIILLCSWELKTNLDSARLLACHTESVNEIAWTFLQNGKLKQLAALLLVAREQVMRPTGTGMTIQQHVMNEIDGLGSEVDSDHQYKSMLMDAFVLFDVFERAGDALSLYCTSMVKRIPPEKVLMDVVALLKKAGFSLQSADLDLRDCYRERGELWKANLFKLSDTPSLDNKFLHRYPSLGTAFGNLRSCHWDPLLARLTSRGVLNLSPSVPASRLLSTAAGSNLPRKNYLAYVALKLRRGIRFM